MRILPLALAALLLMLGVACGFEGGRPDGPVSPEDGDDDEPELEPEVQLQARPGELEQRIRSLEVRLRELQQQARARLHGRLDHLEQRWEFAQRRMDRLTSDGGRVVEQARQQFARALHGLREAVDDLGIAAG